MATIQTNLISLAFKGELIGAQLTLVDDDGSDLVISVDDFEYCPGSETFKIQAGGNVYPVQASYTGTATKTGLSKPSGTLKKHKKLKQE